MAYQIVGLNKVPDTDPQEFMLFYKDLENQKSGYTFSTEHGTQPELHALLKTGGMNDVQISVLFARAK
jgi:hypothetical protein